MSVRLRIHTSIRNFCNSKTDNTRNHLDALLIPCVIVADVGLQPLMIMASKCQWYCSGQPSWLVSPPSSLLVPHCVDKAGAE